ncbi:MAG: hypothetical protein QNM02_16420, partial [Acidimicrobiia bacterium]|nr:hypothetical protein [Acidimicrobiia bacterium]
MATSDVDAIQESIPGMPINIRRLTSQVGSISVTATAVGDVQVFAGEIGFPIVTEAGLSDESCVVALPHEAGDGTGDGHAHDLDRIWFYRPDSEHEGVG